MIENYPSNNIDNHHQNTSLSYLYLGILYISLVGLSYLLPASPGHKRKKIEACKKVDCDEYWFGLNITPRDRHRQESNLHFYCYRIL